MRIRFRAKGCIPRLEAEINITFARSLGLPALGETRRSGKLAVVGQAPSIASHLDELKEWGGDIWAINGAFQWCRRHGIDAAFVTVDPLPDTTAFAYGARTAYVALGCSPALFQAMDGAAVEVFDLGPHDIPHGATTATATPFMALRAGYDDISFFGCDGSTDPAGKTHIAWSETWADRMRVDCGGAQFITKPEFIMQSETLSEMAREFPDIIHVKGGGLLSAMVKNPEWSCVSATKALIDSLSWGNGDGESC